MDNLELKEEKVKEVSVGNGCLYVDLLCGLRLSGPLPSAEDLRAACKAAAKGGRRLMVTGHEALVEEAGGYSLGAA